MGSVSNKEEKMAGAGRCLGCVLASSSNTKDISRDFAGRITQKK